MKGDKLGLSAASFLQEKTCGAKQVEKKESRTIEPI